jgi:hypothetical protein
VPPVRIVYSLHFPAHPLPETIFKCIGRFKTELVTDTAAAPREQEKKKEKKRHAAADIHDLDLSISTLD